MARPGPAPGQRPGALFQRNRQNRGFHRRTPILQQALDLYRGELLPGNYDDWVLLERQRLESLNAQAMEKLLQELEGQREYGRAILYA
jgi:DNA-binding SARP family transcriptional activator